jgi:hypothetical protein
MDAQVYSASTRTFVVCLLPRPFNRSRRIALIKHAPRHLSVNRADLFLDRLGVFRNLCDIDYHKLKEKRPSDFLERLDDSKEKTAGSSVLFDRNRSGLDKRMFVVVRFPVSFVAVPIPLVMAMPIFVIPIVVPAVVVSSGRK